jgi:hypothetical protein
MKRLLPILLLIAAGRGHAQQPFSLDTTFHTDIDKVYVSSVLPLEDGQLHVSGQMHFPDVSTDEILARLNPDGARDTSFPIDQFGGGKLTLWNGKLYVGGAQIVKRSLLNGMPDPTWTQMNSYPQFVSGQGGDYHVFPDGRLLFTGSHGVFDPDHGFNGQYSLVWFSNTGWLDTTRIHRQTDGAIYHIAQLENGQFYCGGAFTQYEGNPAYALARVQPDGAYDPSFQTTILWGEPQALCALPDGRLMVGGDLTFQGGTDTLRLMRFLPDGSLDPDFENHHVFTRSYGDHVLALIRSVNRLDADRFVVCGNFNRIDGEVHGGIAMMDSSGTILDGYFHGNGASAYNYQNTIALSVVGIVPSGNDKYYIWGGYHGYDDGTTNDTLQRMVSRLHGLTVDVPESPVVPSAGSLLIRPNPASTWAVFEYRLVEPVDQAYIRVVDVNGHEVKRMPITAPEGQPVYDTRPVAKGVYTVELVNNGKTIEHGKLIVQ